MKLLTQEQRTKLRQNSLVKDGDHKPVVKLFTPAGSATWLLSELDSDGVAFGLCDLGFGCPEVGYVTMAELEAAPVERDLYFKPILMLGEYAKVARAAGKIIA